MHLKTKKEKLLERRWWRKWGRIQARQLDFWYCVTWLWQSTLNSYCVGWNSPAVKTLPLLHPSSWQPMSTTLPVIHFERVDGCIPNSLQIWFLDLSDLSRPRSFCLASTAFTSSIHFLTDSTVNSPIFLFLWAEPLWWPVSLDFGVVGCVFLAEAPGWFFCFLAGVRFDPSGTATFEPSLKQVTQK